MTDTAVQEQIKTLREATKEASKSKASALKFLRDAGIIKDTPPKPSKKKQ